MADDELLHGSTTPTGNEITDPAGSDLPTSSSGAEDAEAQATTARAALAVIVKAVGLDLPMKPSEASMRVMDRVEELVDEANRLATERDSLQERLEEEQAQARLRDRALRSIAAERDSLAEALKPLIEAVEASEMRTAYRDELDAARSVLNSNTRRIERLIERTQERRGDD